MDLEEEEMMEAEATTIAYAIVSALIYSIVFFAKKRLRKEDPTKFDPIKLVSTLIVGAVIGAGFYLGNFAITALAIETQLLAYGMVIALVESIVKILWRGLQKVI